MARAINKLSPLFVNRHQEPGYYGDGGGLYLQISVFGTKSWIFKYTRGDRTREMGLGSLYDFTLAEAREVATAQRKLLHDGKDPIAERDAARQANRMASARRITFDECAEKYIEAHRAEWKNPKHPEQWTNTLATYASPHVGKLQVSDVDTAAVLKCLEPIWATKTETASRVRARMERVIGWATTHGYRSGDNPARWKDHLDHLLATPNKIRKKKHYPALPYLEMGAFMAELRKRDGISPRALEFAILTAVRSGEVRGATWDEIDLNAAVWTIPAERMKMKKEHRVPLSGDAIKLLESIPRFEDCPFVFPSAKLIPLSNMTLTAVIKRMNKDEARWIDPKTGEGATPHGFRSAFMDWASEMTDYPREVREMSLAHTVGDKVEEAYRRGDLYRKRVCIMEDWAAYCAQVHKPGAVVPIRSSAAA